MNKIRIEVAWYRYSGYRWLRMINGAHDAHGDISRERAQEIIDNNPDGQMVEGTMSFAPDAPSWHWCVDIAPAELVR